jgi:hypothetical protein
VTETRRINADALPKGPQWEQDGSCWTAVREGCDWRWRPMNSKALAKEGPEGEMTDFYPLRREEPHA